MSIWKNVFVWMNADSLLALSLPSRRGIFYRTAKTLNGLGVRSFFERLWQVGMPSPHVHYFDADNLNTLANRFGFIEVERGSLPTLRFRGLYTRISYSGNINAVARIVLYAGIAAAIPFLSLLPKDIIYGIYRRAGRTNF
jgi:hypothetical protein